MPEALTLEEQKKDELELYISSVIYLFSFAALSTFTGLIVLLMNMMALMIFRPKGTSAGALDFVAIGLLVVALFATMLFSYVAVQKFAQGPLFVALVVVATFGLVGGVISKIVFSDVPAVMYYLSFLHEICCLILLWTCSNHRNAFFNAIEYTWDQFDWMDKIVRPGLEEALIRMYLKAKPLEFTPEDEVIIEAKNEEETLDEMMRKAKEYPTQVIKTFAKSDFELDFQNSVKFYTRQKRELCEWMQAVKYDDIADNPEDNAWMSDKIGKTLGRNMMGERAYSRYTEGIRKEQAALEGREYQGKKKKRRPGEPDQVELGPTEIVKVTDF
ncbi:unnamed protein product [Amoebophrya sp. A25]|nr:unnamed protein product [Amoebophrya sp. A25]|eukprot:GSA25T00005521001.1